MSKDVLMLAIHRNESRYLKEWVAWNLYAGASKIVLYDNNVDNPEEETRSRRAVQPFVEQGLVDLVRWHHMEGVGSYAGVPIQYKGCNKWVKNKKHYSVDDGLTRYPGYDIVLKIDIDEFVMPTDKKPLRNVWLRLRDTMVTQNMKCARMDNLHFGTSHLETPPSDIYSVVDTFFMRESKASNFKDAARPEWVSDSGGSSHWWNIKWSGLEYGVFGAGSVGVLFAVWSRFRAVVLILVTLVLLVVLALAYHRCQNAFHVTRVSSQSVVRLHHYCTKTKSEFFERRKYDPDNPKEMERKIVEERFQKANAMYNQVEDRFGKEMFKEFIDAVRDK